MSDGGAPTPAPLPERGRDTDTTRRERAAIEETVFRTLMAEKLGYGVTGDKRLGDLTHAEQRAYAEGLRIQARRQQRAQTLAQTDGQRARPKGEPRDSDLKMAEDLKNDIVEQQNGSS